MINELVEIWKEKKHKSMRIVRRLYQILTTHPKVSKENVEKMKVRTIKIKKKPIEYLRLISMSQTMAAVVWLKSWNIFLHWFIEIFYSFSNNSFFFFEYLLENIILYFCNFKICMMHLFDQNMKFLLENGQNI